MLKVSSLIFENHSQNKKILIQDFNLNSNNKTITMNRKVLMAE